MDFEVFELGEKRSAIRTMARKFAQEHVKPISAETDRLDVRENFPWDMFKKASKLGLRTLALPEKYGGQYIDLLTRAIVSYEIGYFDAPCAKIIGQCWKTSRLLHDHGTEEQRERFLTAYRNDDTYIMSVAMTEPEAGCDNQIPYNEPDGGLKLSVTKKGNGYVLNGTKRFIAHGNVSKLFIVAGRVDPTVGFRDATAFFLVPRDTPGFSVVKIFDKVGFRAYGNAQLEFKDVFVPKENLLGGKDRVDMVGFAQGVWGNLEVSVLAVAIMQAAFDTAFEYAKTRVQGGKTIIEHQAVATMLADIYMNIKTSESLIYRVLQLENQKMSDKKLAIATKVCTSEALINSTLTAMRMFGGLGVMKDMPLEKYVRDSLVFFHWNGTNEVNKLTLLDLLRAA